MLNFLVWTADQGGDDDFLFGSTTPLPPTHAHRILILSQTSLPYLESIDVVRLRSMGMRARPKNPNVNATVTRNCMNHDVPGLT